MNWSGTTKSRRLVLLLQRADGGDGDDALDAELLHAEDVGAEVELGGQDAVAAAVTGQEGDLAALQLAENESVEGSPNGVVTRSS